MPEAGSGALQTRGRAAAGGRGERSEGRGGGLRRRSTPATGRRGGRSARNEPDFVRRARDVTGTLTVTEPKRGRLPAAPRYVPDPAPRPRTTEALHRHGTLPNHAGFRRIPVSSGTGGGGACGGESERKPPENQNQGTNSNTLVIESIDPRA